MIDLHSVIANWEIFGALFKKSFGFEFKSLEDFINFLSGKNSELKWYNLNGWETLDDNEIFKNLNDLREITGVIYIITEASYRNNLGPFELKGEQLSSFIEGYTEQCSECFFNGDVVITNLVKRLLWIFHHEGVFTFIDRS